MTWDEFIDNFTNKLDNVINLADTHDLSRCAALS